MCIRKLVKPHTQTIFSEVFLIRVLGTKPHLCLSLDRPKATGS